MIKSAVNFFIKDHQAAHRLVNHLVKSKNDRIILPVSGYPGPFTETLLSTDFETLTVCEPNERVRKEFQAHLDSEFPHKRINVLPYDFFPLTFSSFDEEAQGVCAEIVSETSRGSVSDLNLRQAGNIGHTSSRNCDSFIKCLIPLMKIRYEVAFIKNLFYQVGLKTGLFSGEPIKYYFLVSSSGFANLTAKPSKEFRIYKASTILTNLVFNINHLETYDLRSCFQISTIKLGHRSQSVKKSRGDIHLIELVPKMDIVDNLDPVSSMEFRFLVTQMMVKRTKTVVNAIENFFEGCTQDLNRLFGIKKTTRTGDLTPQQYYEIFLYLKQREDYSISTFRVAASQPDEVWSLKET